MGLQPAPATDLGILPIREYLLVGLTAAAVTFLLTGLVRLVAIRIGAVATPRERDVHVTPMPRLGGLAMYLGVLAGMVLANHLPVLRSAFEFSWDAVAVVAAGALIVVVGALDDRFDLDAITKLAGQVTAAGVLVLFGVQWFLFWVPWGGENGSLGSVLLLGQDQAVLLTVLMTVVLANAINFVDGLDGLAAGIGLIAAAAIGAFSLGQLDSRGSVDSYPPVLIAATLAGACLGFLPHNFQPARIFMGDSGSMLIGLMLAAGTTSASGRVETRSTTGPSETLALLSPLLVVAAVLFVPVLDLVLAVLRRTRAGLHPFHPDKMHLHHRLLEIGHSQRRAVLLVYLWAALLAFGAVALTMLDAFVVAWGMSVGLLLALLASVIPSLRTH